MIKKYKKKDGTTAYMFVAYLCTDPITGKQKRTTRRGFKTEREAKIAEARLQREVSQNGFLNNDITTV
ncbi:Arm DNA-binding domain-containing protein [Staphylococcus pseudintermedius]|nr:Arm DNA-binding domain-containing protein [Staphylococcus pseudintermedius]MDE9822052.1 Arm DNA-binding domain-containing protein [Staphylococcus pseudintermedius]MDE9826738.1 Arm DNA-binding domain-containing protein [Staphylococcus pseudintermedius]